MAQTDSPNSDKGTRSAQLRALDTAVRTGVTVAVTMVEAHGTLCGRCRGGKASTPTRCWPHEQFPDAPAICGRCRQVVDGMVESGDLTPDVLDPPRPYPPEADCPVCAGRCRETTAP